METPLPARPYLCGSALILVAPAGTFQFYSTKGATKPPRHMSMWTGMSRYLQQAAMTSMGSQVPQGQLGQEVQTQMVWSSMALFMAAKSIWQLASQGTTLRSMSRQAQALMTATCPVEQATTLGLQTPFSFILYQRQLNMAMRMDQVPPELRVPQGCPCSSFMPMHQALMAITSSSICLTKGKDQACRGLAQEKYLERLATNLQWVQLAYLEPEDFPLSDSFSESSLNLIQTGLQGIFQFWASISGGQFLRMSILANYTCSTTFLLIGGSLNITFRTEYLMAFSEKLASRLQTRYSPRMSRLRMMNFQKWLQLSKRGYTSSSSAYARDVRWVYRRRRGCRQGSNNQAIWQYDVIQYQYGSFFVKPTILFYLPQVCLYFTLANGFSTTPLRAADSQNHHN